MKKLNALIIGLIIILSVSVALADITSSRDEGEFKEYRIQVGINRGWNLIAGIGDPRMANIQPSDISIDNLKYIWAFYSNLQEYGFTHPKIDENKRSSLTLEDFRSMGFWVYSDKKGTLDFYTDHFKDFDQRTMYQGWNFLAITPEFKDQSLDQLKGTCEIEAAFSFDITGQVWTSVSLTHETFGDYMMGRAIVMKVADRCRFSEYEEGQEITPPPAIPTSYGTECKDTDNGKDYYTKGIITKGSTKAEDECNTNGAFGPDPNIMWEHYCDNDGNPQGEWFSCPKGCFKGACI